MLVTPNRNNLCHSLSTRSPPKKGSRTKKFRVGRGYATGRGTTAGRGTKGQRARTPGGRKRLKLKGLKQMLLAFPKSRGFNSMYPTVYAVPADRIVKPSRLVTASTSRPSRPST